MSEGYREESRFEYDSEEGDPIGQVARTGDLELDTDALLEEIGRFENFDVEMVFTSDEWHSFSVDLRSYILAQRLVNKVPNLVRPRATIPKAALGAEHDHACGDL